MKISTRLKTTLASGVAGAAAGYALSDDTIDYGGIATTAGVGLALGGSFAYTNKLTGKFLSGAGFSPIPEHLMDDVARQVAGTNEPLFNQMKSNSNMAVLQTLVDSGQVIGSRADSFTKLRSVQNVSAALNNNRISTLNPKSSTVKELESWYETNKQAYDNAGWAKKAGIVAAYNVNDTIDGLKANFLDPVTSLGTKLKTGNFTGITGNELAATAFNAFGVYEGYKAFDSAANGEYQKSVGHLATLSAGRMAYAQGTSLFAARNFMKENNLSMGDVVSSAFTSQAAKKATRDFGD